MKLQTGLVALSLSFASNAYTTDDTGNIGFGVNLGVSGFFSPVVEEVQVTSIETNSPAEKAGIQVGDKIVAIDNINVAGCSTYETKQRMSRKSGEELALLLERNDGSQIETKVRLG